MTPNFEFTKSIYPIFIDLHPYSGICKLGDIFVSVSNSIAFY